MKWLVFAIVGTFFCSSVSVGEPSDLPLVAATPPSAVNPENASAQAPSVDSLPPAEVTHDPTTHQDIIKFLKTDRSSSLHEQIPAPAPIISSRAQLYPFLERFLNQNNPTLPTPSSPLPPATSTSTSVSNAAESVNDALLALNAPKTNTPAPAPTNPTAEAITQAPTALPATALPAPLPLPESPPASAPVTPIPPVTTPVPPAPISSEQVPPLPAPASLPDQTAPLPPSLPTATAPTEVANEPILPTRKPAPSTNPLATLEASDRRYLNELENARKTLPKDKTLSAPTQQVLDNIEDSMAVQRALREFSDIPIIEHGELKNEIKDKQPLAEGQKPRVSLTVTDESKAVSESNQKISLDAASRALVAGQISAAISMYKDILAIDKHNRSALFGLATAYHKDKQFEEARHLYTELLEVEPNHKEALNNFLSLAAEEAPEDALIELKKLERINPTFSPVLAQIGMIYLKTNRLEQAEFYLRRALSISSDNIAYKYNLAIILDHRQKYPQAISMYQQLVEAEKSGEPIPGSYAQIHKRLLFLKENTSY